MITKFSGEEFDEVRGYVNEHAEEIMNFYSKYGVPNGVGIGADGIVVMFEKLNRGAKPPTEYEGRSIKINVIGKVVAL
jgi:hypothetical protein